MKWVMLYFIAFGIHSEFAISQAQPDIVQNGQKHLDDLLDCGLKAQERGAFDSAIVYFHTGVKLASQNAKYLRSLSLFYRHLGGLYVGHSNFAEGIYFYEKSLEAAKIVGDHEIYMQQLAEAGSAYMGANEPEKALQRFLLAREYGYKYNNPTILTRALNSLGDLSRQKGDPDQAIAYHQEAIEVNFQRTGNRNEHWACTSLGKIYTYREECDKATEYLNIVIDAMETDKVYNLAAQAYLNLALCDKYTGNLTGAIEKAEKAFAICQTLPDIDLQASIAEGLSVIYEEAGKPVEALKYQIKFKNLSDSLGNAMQARRISEIMFSQKEQKLLDQMAQNDKLLEVEKENRLRESKRYRNIIISTIIITLVTIGYGLFIYRSLQRNRKQKKIIQDQKEDILRSIHYAKRIQSAILPPISVLQDYLPECFVLYKPKDIVAGDFYWIEKFEDKVLLAVADCTGHGVPGAMVSVICNNGLNRAVREYGFTDPGEILTKTRDIVVSQFEKSEDEVHDGMDIALCVLEGHTLKFAGANNPLWLIRGEEIKEIEADKAPIGKFVTSKPFQTHELKLEPGDAVYLFSDGYSDQFGGNAVQNGKPANKNGQKFRGKKFKTSAFKSLLLSISKEPMSLQREIIHRTFENWRGELPQVDDVCVIGIRIQKNDD